jgi:ribonuclease R
MTKKTRWQDRDPRFAEESGRYEAPIPSRQFILDQLAEAGAPVSFDALCAKLGLRERRAREALTKRLGAMARDGQLLVNRAEEYLLLDRLPLVVGTVSGHRDGFGFLVPEDGGDDLFLSFRQMRSVMHGDRVAARVTGRDARGRREGAVVEVLERRTRQVAGRFWFEADVGFVEPDNSRISHRVVIPAKARAGAKSGDLVVAELVEPPTAHASPVGRISRVLPVGGTADTAVELARGPHAPAAGHHRRRGRPRLRRRGLGRADRRPTGWRLLVAIADVATTSPGSALDREAASARQLGLLPRPRRADAAGGAVQRLVLAAPARSGCAWRRHERGSTDGRAHAHRFVRALMRSAARLTYEQVQAALDGEPAARAELAAVMPAASARAYRALRRGASSAACSTSTCRSAAVIVDEAAASDIRAPAQRRHRLIEEFMIAANVEPRRSSLKRHKLPCMYSVHDRPSEEAGGPQAVPRLRGLTCEMSGELEPKQRRSCSCRSLPGGRGVVNELHAARQAAQAAYDPDNIGHFGLALASTCHFTSPIRRYPDLLVHRAIRHALADGTADDFVHSARQMEQLGQECSLRERRADEASRSVVAFLKCEFMKDRIGEEFDAVATGVTDFGVFVQLKGLQVDGLVHVSSLPRDYFRFHEQDRMLVGEKSGQRYGIGDELRVRLVRVDSSERKIDFELVEKVAGGFHPRRSKGGRARR